MGVRVPSLPPDTFILSFFSFFLDPSLRIPTSYSSIGLDIPP
jgi:hypothetical protein